MTNFTYTSLSMNIDNKRYENTTRTYDNLAPNIAYAPVRPNRKERRAAKARARKRRK